MLDGDTISKSILSERLTSSNNEIEFIYSIDTKHSARLRSGHATNASSRGYSIIFSFRTRLVEPRQLALKEKVLF